VVPAKSITRFSEIRRLPISPSLLAQLRRKRIPTHGIRGVRPHPPWPPFARGGKGRCSPRRIVSAQPKDAIYNGPFTQVNIDVTPRQGVPAGRMRGRIPAGKPSVSPSTEGDRWSSPSRDFGFFFENPVPECPRRACLQVAAMRRDGSPGRTPSVARLRGPEPGRALSCRHSVTAGIATPRGPFIRNSSPISRGSAAWFILRASAAGAGP
jgi:hypothetical protein